MSTKFEKVQKFVLSRKKFRFGDLNKHFGRPVSELNSYTTYLNTLRDAGLVKQDGKGNYFPVKKELKRITLADLLLRKNYKKARVEIAKIERERNDLLRECRTAHNDANSWKQVADVAEELLVRERKEIKEFKERYEAECEAVSRNLSFVRDTKNKKIYDLEQKLGRSHLAIIVSLITLIAMNVGIFFHKKADKIKANETCQKLACAYEHDKPKVQLMRLNAQINVGLRLMLRYETKHKAVFIGVGPLCIVAWVDPPKREEYIRA